MLRFTIAALAALSAAVPAAAVTKLYEGTDDAAYEGAAGWLATTYGLTVPAGNVGNVVLPQLERAVGEVRIGRPNNSERTRALHSPTTGSGLPAPNGSGVVNALTNYNPVSSANTAIVNGQNIAFSFNRTGDTVTYNVGAYSGSFTAGYVGQINAFQIRTRSGQNSTTSVLGLSYMPAGGTVQNLGDWSSSGNGNVQIALFGGVAGDFTVSGQYRFDWTGGRPNGSAMASQLKLLELPTSAIPEPGTWALMILGFGLVGAAARRRAAVAAVNAVNA